LSKPNSATLEKPTTLNRSNTPKRARRLADRSFSSRGSQTNRLVGEIMVSFDHSHRPAPGAHQIGVSDGRVSAHAHAAEKR